MNCDAPFIIDDLVINDILSTEPLDISVFPDTTEKLSEKLAAYMIPQFYMHLEKFPLNQNGKIDRKNLPEPDIMSKRAEYVPPQDETQAVLCRAFESALGAEQIGIDDDFFSMGGDSIRVMKLND